jgi:hypothetical protein
MIKGSSAPGGVVRLDPTTYNPVTTIPFQFNPAAVRRTLQAATVGGQPGGHSEAVQFTGAPTEIYALEVELDAYNPGLLPNVVNSGDGLYPMLYALETLVYPPMTLVDTALSALNTGTMEIAPIAAPPVLLILGSNRVVPVVMQSYSIVEQAFDTNLNPLRAVVSISARVLSYSDTTYNSLAYQFYKTYQQAKESMAGLLSV